MEQFCQQNNFTFHFTHDPDIDADEIYLPSMLIQPYIENAVIHGISHLQSPGKIDISFQMKNAQLVCTIEDNGVGRKKRQNYPSTAKRAMCRLECRSPHKD